MNRAEHWNGVYTTRAADEVSWHQAEPALSLELIRRACPAGGSVVDVGGGQSLLVDHLVREGFQPAVLDVSAVAIDRAKGRLGALAEPVRWIVADVTEVAELGRFDAWHDRAVFHFLIDPRDRRAYRDLAARSVGEGGHLILATFAPDGPTRCSGLDVCRYDGAAAAGELGPAFALVEERRETHRTPAGKPQQFFYGLFVRR